MRTLRFYFDYISPYAYLAWTQIHALAERHEVVVEPVPVLFAAMLDAHGTKGPAETPARRNYLVRDVARIAHRFGVPLAPPPAHPFNPLLALRVTYLAAEPRALIDDLYRATWATGEGVADPEVVARLARAHGVDSAAAPTMKERVRTETAAAIARGIFGVPSMIVDDQLFWGCDSLPHLEHYLAHGNVVSADVLARWDALPAAAVRTRSQG